MAAAAAAAEIVSDELSSSDRALIDLFSNLYNDSGLKGSRSRHEEGRASTKTQTKLSGISGTPNVGEPELSVLLKDKQQAAEAEAAAASQTGKPLSKGKKDEINRRNLDTFRQNYSWLTSVRMDTEGEEDEILVGNEDEHALPFGFMLVFGGAIAAVPGDYSEQQLVLEQFTQYLKKIEEEGRPKGVPQNIQHLLANIQEVGYDYSLLYKTDDVVLEILNAIDVHNYQKFLKNSLTLNYYGLFLSEADSNQWKSNLVFVKLVVKPDGSLCLEPWGTMIIAFIDAVAERVENEINGTRNGAMWQKMVTLYQERKEKKNENTTYYPGGSPTKKNSKFYKENLKAVFRERGVEIWKQTAIDNIAYIVQFLCNHYNKDLKKRTFFNCVLLKYNEMNENLRKNKYPTGQAVAVLQNPRGNAAAATPPGKSQVVVASSQTEASELSPVHITTAPIDAYILAYAREHRIVFHDKQLQQVVRSCKSTVLKKAREMDKKKQKMGGVGGTRRRKKTKRRRKNKRKKKTKRRRKKKKRTRRRR